MSLPVTSIAVGKWSKQDYNSILPNRKFVYVNSPPSGGGGSVAGRSEVSGTLSYFRRSDLVICRVYKQAVFRSLGSSFTGKMMKYFGIFVAAIAVHHASGDGGFGSGGHGGGLGGHGVAVGGGHGLGGGLGGAVRGGHGGYGGGVATGFSVFNLGAPLGGYGAGGSSLRRGGLSGGSSLGHGGLAGGSSLGHGGLAEGASLGHGSFAGGSSLGHGGLAGGASLGHGSFAGGSSLGHSSLVGGSSLGHGGLAGGSSLDHGGLAGAQSLGFGGLDVGHSAGHGGALASGVHAGGLGGVVVAPLGDSYGVLFTGIFLMDKTPDTSFQIFHPVCFLPDMSFTSLPSTDRMEPRLCCNSSFDSTPKPRHRNTSCPRWSLFYAFYQHIKYSDAEEGP
ncbi:uncharacterized protein LOC134771255 [Penaeus indicus]|uniref:uncharacterized protein LOC134771255 n=1 Tax=Penaeus indicus TaxID=29960 RepID=UPI00300C41AC